MQNNTPYFPEYQTAQESLKRRQAQIDAIVKASQEPGRGGAAQFVNNAAGTFYAGDGGGGALGNIASGIGKVINAYSADKSQKALDADSAALGQKFQAGQTDAINAYNTTRQGTPAVQGAQPGDGVGPVQELSPAVDGDPRQAAVNAVISGYPGLKELGTLDLKRLDEGQVGVKDLLKYSATDKLPDLVRRGVAGFVPKQEYGNVDNVLYNQGGSGGPTAVTLGGPGYTEKVVDGDRYKVNPTTGGASKLDNAPKVTVNNKVSVINEGAKELAKQLAGIAAKDFELSAQGAQGAQRALDAVAKIRSLPGTYTGPTATPAVFVAGVAQSLGLKVDTTKLASAETLEAESAKLWLEAMNAAGGARGLVKEESERIAKSVPGLIHSPEGREKLLSFIEDRAGKSLGVADKKRAAIIKAGRANDPGAYFEGVTEGPLLGVPATVPGQPAANNPSRSTW